VALGQLDIPPHQGLVAVAAADDEKMPLGPGPDARGTGDARGQNESQASGSRFSHIRLLDMAKGRLPDARVLQVLTKLPPKVNAGSPPI
jgi:hypothetical protein